MRPLSPTLGVDGSLATGDVTVHSPARCKAKDGLHHLVHDRSPQRHPGGKAVIRRTCMDSEEGAVLVNFPRFLHWLLAAGEGILA